MAEWRVADVMRQTGRGDDAAEIRGFEAIQGMPRDQIRARVDEVARILGISNMLDRPVGGLSGGDRQRPGDAQRNPP